MANSPLINQTTDLVTTEVLVGGKLLDGMERVYSVEVDSEINRIARAEICILDGNPSKQEFVLQDKDTLKVGKDVEIKLGYHQDTKTVFKGVIIKTGVRIRHGQHSLLYAECADECIKMTVERKSEIFTEKKDSDIISKCVQNAGLAKDVESTSIVHKEIVQYYCTDWDFAVSRAEKNGLVVYTDENKFIAEKPVTADDKVGMEFGTDIIKSNLYFHGPSQLKDVNSKSWDHNQQKIVENKSTEPSVNSQGDLQGKSVASDFNKSKFEFHHSGPVSKAELKAWSDAKLLKSRYSRIRGTITFQGHADPKPNTTVDMKNVGKHFTGSAYVSGVKHRVMEGNWVTEVKVGLDPEWYTETKPLIQAGAASGLMPGIQGLYIGTVKKIHQDPENQYRVQVDVPVIDPSGEGIWARLSQIYASKEYGAFWYPQVNDEVILGFVQGDPRYPIILGSVYNKKNPPAYQPDQDNSVQAFTTKNDLKLILHDKDKDITLSTPGGHEVLISDKDKKINLKDSNNNEITMDNKGITIKSCKDVIIESSQMGKIEMKGGSGGITGKSNAGKVEFQGMSFKGKGQTTATVEGGLASLKATTGICTVKGTVVMIN